MHNGALKKMALALTFWLALHTWSLKAQILPLGPYGTSPTAFEVDANGLLSSTGTLGNTEILSSNLTGAGTRMLWYPGLAAVRAGSLDSDGATDWNPSNLGEYSAAFGLDTTASGADSFAAGYGSSAQAEGSVALGSFATATGTDSFALGLHVSATGNYAVALGCYNTASSAYSTVSGAFSSASGVYSTVSGGYNGALGRGSTVSGVYSQALGNFSAAIGSTLTAGSCYSFVIGTCNLDQNSSGGTPSSAIWNAIDPLFEIGNGSFTERSDALVVYKNGNTVIQGTLTVKSVSGDIPMYTGQ